VPEVVDDGVTGFIVETVGGAVRALDRVARFDRERCRRVFEERFCVGRMAADYVKIYNRLIENDRCRPNQPTPLKRAHAAALATNGNASSGYALPLAAESDPAE
jgi:hypothetical protein